MYALNAQTDAHHVILLQIVWLVQSISGSAMEVAHLAIQVSFQWVEIQVARIVHLTVCLVIQPLIA